MDGASTTTTRGARCWTRRAGLLVSGLVFAFIGIAAMAKCVDLQAFYVSLEQWRLPTWSRMPLTVAVPAIELVLAAMWFTGKSRKSVEEAAIGLLAAFLIVLVYQLQGSTPPDCNCLGLIERYFGFVSSLKVALARDILLLVLLIVGIGLSRRNAVAVH